MADMERYLPYLVNRGDRQQEYAFECTWNYFVTHFWRNIKPREIVKQFSYERAKNKEITPMAAWTEIISTIKGCSHSFTRPGQCLPLEEYLQRSRNKFYGDPERRAIYEIFKQYEEWKRKSLHKTYDIMDLTNHLLR